MGQDFRVSGVGQVTDASRSTIPDRRGNWIFSCASYFAARQDHDHWFNNNPSCYHAVPGYVLPTNSDAFENLRQMDDSSLNFALARTFPLTERYSLQFRGEAFNAMNHPLYGAPVTKLYD